MPHYETSFSSVRGQDALRDSRLDARATIEQANVDKG
jgi:hypothetical protein